MLQPARDFRFAHKARPALRMMGVPRLDLFQRHLAVQLAVPGHEDFAQPAAGVRPQNLKPRPIGGDGGGGSQRAVDRRRRERQLGQAGVQFSVGDVAQLRAHRRGSRQRPPGCVRHRDRASPGA